MKILFLTDTHFTGRTPSSRLDNIQETILNKLNDVRKIIESEKVELVLHGGDMFNSADVANNFTGTIAETLRAFKVPIYVVPGNHDLYGAEFSTISNTKLGLLARAGVIRILSRSSPLVIEEEGFKLIVDGQEYHPHIDEGYEADYSISEKGDCNILITHSMLMDKKFIEGVKHTLIEDVKTEADIVLSGHYHPGYKEIFSDNTWFFNPGSTVRMEASAHSKKTLPKVLLLEVGREIFEYKYIALKSAKKGSEVFSNKNEEDKIYNTSLENFHNAIKERQIEGVDALSMLENYNKLHECTQEDIDYIKGFIIKAEESSIDKGYIASEEKVKIIKVEIKNFQTHKDKTIVFDAGLNVILGESNSGKTSILRAIAWVLYNTSGSDFITAGAKSCSVTLHLSNDYVITRKRTKTSAGSYIIKSPNGEEKEYKGFSNNIPVEVLNAHQSPSVKIGSGKTAKEYKFNVAMQLDAPFLIDDSSTDRLLLLGAITNADKLDDAAKAINGEKRRLNSSLTSTKKFLAEKEEQVLAYKDVDLLKIAIDKVDALKAILDKKQELLSNLNDCKTLNQNHNNALKVVKERLTNITIPPKELLEDLKSKAEKLDKLTKLSYSRALDFERYESIIGKLSLSVDLELAKGYMVEAKEKYETLVKAEETLTKRKDLNKKVEFLENTNVYDISTLKANLSTLLSKYELLEGLSDKLKESIEVNQSIYKIKEHVENNKSKVIELKNSIEEILKSIEGATETCKYCGSVVDVKQIIEN